MIDQSYVVGDRVVNKDAHNDYGVNVDEVGTIVGVDLDDKFQTYRVRWPSDSVPVWWGNADLEPDYRSDDMECNWKNRALRAETQLKELKDALKTLSEG